MGKPPATFPPTAEADAISLHTQPDHYFDDDAPSLGPEIDDLPPLYTDHDESAGGPAPSAENAALLSQTSTGPQSRELEPNRVGPSIVPFSRDDATGAQYYTDPRLSQDPAVLEDFIKIKSRVPPRQLVRLHGWHWETVRKDNDKNKTERKQVTDFDIHVDLTPYLDVHAQMQRSWHRIRTADNFERARRGTVFRKQGPPQGRLGDGEAHFAPDDGPTLEEWCHRFCASSAGMRCFRLQRTVVGLDTSLLHAKLMHLRQSTNYRGHFDVSFPVRDAIVDIYSPGKITEWRLTAWIRWLFYLSFLWIFTWPFLFFATKRYEVVFAVWPFSRGDANGQREFASVSEEQWYGMWGRVLHSSILRKRQGFIEPQEIEVHDRSAPPAFNTGNTGVDSALDFVAASVAAFGEVNRASGWGYDTS
jgi:hypothetical protein